MLRQTVSLALASSLLLNAAAECTFRANPDDFLQKQARGERGVFERTAHFQASLGKQRPAAESVPASELPPRNFIDEEIFGKLAQMNVKSAALSTDEEFIRRVTLDLTGTLPSPADIRAFLADEDPGKRDVLIDKLTTSSAFVDRWTMWWGDLLENCNFPALFDRREDGRNAYYTYIKRFVQNNSSLRDVVPELLSQNGNHYDGDTGATNFSISAKTNMGPAQDTYDNGLVKASTYFLGMAQYDCLLCHDGRGKLDEINLWGSKAKRVDAWKMASFFSRLNMPSRNVASTNFYYFSYDVSDRTTGTYDLNTTTGNRPPRNQIGTLRNLTPEYRDTGNPNIARAPAAGQAWREALGQAVYQDPMFAMNFANRFWREFFGMGLVEPYDMLDPDRLDPDNPPPAPWTMQATHPALLKKLAERLRESDYNVRNFMRFLTKSNAYQMSSRYDGKWTLDMVPLFARHYPRRLWAEEIHDIVANASGVYGNYTPKNFPAVRLAMQLPDTDEPRNDGATGTFLNYFLRGNRDSRQRTGDLTIQQRLALMNDNFINNRTRATAPNLAVMFRIADNAQVTEEVYLSFLGRRPTEAETDVARKYLEAAKTATERNNALEDMVWACINKADFQFSY